MENLIQILSALALVGAFALCVALIVCIIRFYKFLQILQIEIVDISRNLKPILENLNIASEKFRIIASKIDEQVNTIHTLFIVFRKFVCHITELGERFEQLLEEPIMRVGVLFSNVINRVASFFSKRSKEYF